MPSGKAAPPETAVVIGAGLVGTCCALSLQERGVTTMLVDPDLSPPRASWGNAGHIAVEQVEPLASRATLSGLPRRLFSRGGVVSLPPGDIAAWLPFALRFVRASSPARFAGGKAALSSLMSLALPAWRRRAAAAGVPELLAEDGHYLVWESTAAAAAGRASWAKADTGTVTVRAAAIDELAAISAHLARPLAGGLRFEGSGQIRDLGDMAQALDSRFAALGGTHLEAAAQSLSIRGGKAAALIEGGEMVKGDAVVVAAGAGSGRLLAPLGHKVPLIAERGYHIQSPASDWPEHLPPVVFEERGMIVTRFRSGFRAASFFEFGRAESPPDPRKWARLRTHVRQLGISFGGSVTEWMGARPTLPDYLPAIGRSARADNLFYAFGHQHLGLTLSAATGELVGALIAGEATAINLSPFDIARFGGG